MLVNELISSDLNVSITLKKSDLFDPFREVSEQRAVLENALAKEKEKVVYYTPKEVKEMYHMDLSTIWRHEQRGLIRGVKLGGKKLFPKSEIEKLLM